MGIFDFLKDKPVATITGINLKLQGYTHTMKGMDVKARTFSIEVPFTNKSHADMLTQANVMKAQKAEPIKIKSIEVGEPFKLVSIEPAAPLEIAPDMSVTFKMSIESPEHSYTGPMSISFLSDTVELVHVEISRTVLSAKGKKIPIPVSSRILNIPKGQIFTEKIQLYKAFSYGDTVSSITIEPPFSFVGSDPKLPLKIDDINSYIIELQIQAPQNPYAGELEIGLS